MRTRLDRSVVRAIAIAALLLSPGAARADAIGPDDEACLRLKEGDACNERREESGGPGYRGVCVLVKFDEGRSRLRCNLPDLELSKEEAPCFRRRKGDTCWRDSGAEGTCVDGRQMKVTAFGGGATIDLPINKCARLEKDKSGEDLEGWIFLGGVIGASALVAGALVWRQRQARRKASGEEQPGE